MMNKAIKCSRLPRIGASNGKNEATDYVDVIGVDVGGKFPDLIQLDRANGAVRLAKVPSKLHNIWCHAGDS